MEKLYLTDSKLDILPEISCAYFFNKRLKPGRQASEYHTHNECEIYINISGNVSFCVEDKVYAVRKGDIIITRPDEKHYCILNESLSHDHFCMNFSFEKMKELLPIFFDRKAGENNLIVLAAHKKEELFAHCRELVENEDPICKHIAFYSILNLISGGKTTGSDKNITKEVAMCLEYIEANFASEITVPMLAELSHISENALTRQFRRALGVSPYAHVQNIRFSKAIAILQQGGNVSEAALASGFSDYSHFIAAFRKKYGITPLKFKKEMER